MTAVASTLEMLRIESFAQDIASRRPRFLFGRYLVSVQLEMEKALHGYDSGANT
jgi:hypothetical protein